MYLVQGSCAMKNLAGTASQGDLVANAVISDRVVWPALTLIGIGAHIAGIGIGVTLGVRALVRSWVEIGEVGDTTGITASSDNVVAMTSPLIDVVCLDQSVKC